MGLTIKDIARMAGTSVSTVSRALSGSPGVSESKRQSILELCKRSGFQPNRIAQNLVRSRSFTLGFIASDIENVFYFQFFRFIERRCKQEGYQIFLTDSEQDVEKEKTNIEVMLQRRVDGLIVFPVHDYVTNTRVDHLLQLQLDRVPFVVAGRIRGYTFDCVTSEEVESACELTRHLIELGHRRIAFLGYDPLNRCVTERFEGFRKALAEAGLELPPQRIFTREDVWFDQVPGLMAKKDRPTAFVAVNDTFALKLMPTLRNEGLSIPDDVSIATFDDSLWSKHLQPALTTCAVDYEKVGERIMDVLLRRIKDPEGPPEQHLIAQKQILRDSCAPCPKSLRTARNGARL